MIEPTTPPDQISPTLMAWLIEHGFNPNDLNQAARYEDSPLILASRHGEESIVDELLACQVNVNHRNMDGTNALWASIVCDSFSIADKLLQADCDLDNQNENGATALMYASSAGKTEWVAWLLGKGARIDCESLDGFSALDLAANIACLKLLKQGGLAARNDSTC